MKSLKSTHSLGRKASTERLTSQQYAQAVLLKVRNNLNLKTITI